MQGNNKFLFDLNNFDEPDSDQPEEELIPTFTQEEVDAARDAGFQKGKGEGLQEERDSRDQRVEQKLGQIQQSLQTLITAENMREQQYEEETLALMHAALKKLFPTLNKRMGLDELEAMIERVIQSQNNLTTMIIAVPSEFTGDIEALLAKKITDELQKTKYKVVGDDSLQDGGCTLSWEDGGAMRDSGKLIEDMILEVEKLLPLKASDSAEPPKDDIKEDDTTDQTSTDDNPDGDNE